MVSILKFLYLLSLVVWIGGMAFFSFFAAPSIFKVLPRELAGVVVGDIFPKYYLIGYLCCALALVTLISIAILEKSPQVWRGVFCLLLMGGVLFTMGTVVGPRVNTVREEIKAVQDETRKAELEKRFGQLHGASMALNLVVMILGLVLLFITAVQLRL